MYSIGRGRVGAQRFHHEFNCGLDAVYHLDLSPDVFYTSHYGFFHPFHSCASQYNHIHSCRLDDFQRRLPHYRFHIRGITRMKLQYP